MKIYKCQGFPIHYEKLVTPPTRSSELPRQFQQPPGSNSCWIYASNHFSYLLTGNQFNDFNKTVEIVEQQKISKQGGTTEDHCRL